MTDYQKVAKAIEYIGMHFQEQPKLEEVAKQVHLSPYHFQRLFSRWAGVSPKKFLQFLSINYAKQILDKEQATLFDVTDATGLSGTGRLHDLFVKIAAMTPGEYKTGGQKLGINYSFGTSFFGDFLVASTNRGICHLAFYDNQETVLKELRQLWPEAVLLQKEDGFQLQIKHYFQSSIPLSQPVQLHLKGTPFQLKVWEALLKIPQGRLSSYSRLARDIGKPKASRAVGTAIGNNPVAFLIPCHRVIRKVGTISGYRWGATRKKAILGWEFARTLSNTTP